MQMRKFTAPTRASSIATLSAQFRESGLVTRHRSVKCAGRDFLWFWGDEGSGTYLIHGFLYEVARDGVRLVLDIPPEDNRMEIAAEAGKDRILLQGRTRQKPRETRIIAAYYPAH